MARSSNPQLVRQWRERLQRFDHSQWTVAEFCDAEGYSVASFYQWRRKLKASVAEVQPQTSDRPASFVAVELEPSALEPTQRVGLEIELPGGAVARLDHDATDEQQRRLIRNVIESLSEVAS